MRNVPTSAGAASEETLCVHLLRSLLPPLSKDSSALCATSAAGAGRLASRVGIAAQEDRSIPTPARQAVTHPEPPGSVRASAAGQDVQNA